MIAGLFVVSFFAALAVVFAIAGLAMWNRDGVALFIGACAVMLCLILGAACGYYGIARAEDVSLVLEIAKAI